MYSIVVPTYNRAHGIVRTLESLLAQEAPCPYEVIVVDNNSSDATPSVVKNHEAKAGGLLRYVREPRQGLSFARNAGIAASTGEVVVFVDDDVIASPGWLTAIVAAYREHADAWCVGGRIVLDPQVILPPWFDPTSGLLSGFISCLNLGDGTVRLEYPRDVWGANFSVKRDVLSRIGLFDPALGASGMDHHLGGERHLAGEETDLCLRIYRAGGAVYYCGRAVVTHMVPASRITKRYFRQRAYWLGRTRAILFPKPPRRSWWRWFAGLSFGIAKACLRAARRYIVGDGRQAFAHELEAWALSGGLHQSYLMAGARGRNTDSDSELERA